MDGDVSAPARDVVRAVLQDLVPVALLRAAHHRVHRQLLHSLPGYKIISNLSDRWPCSLGLVAEGGGHGGLDVKVVQAQGERPAGAAEHGRHGEHLGGEVVQPGRGQQRGQQGGQQRREVNREERSVQGPAHLAR